MNAAPLYLEAFAHLPMRDYGTLSELLGRSPADPESFRLLDAATVSLTLLHTASRVLECDWGRHADLEAMSCDYSAARCLARLAVFRAEHAFLAQDHAGGLDDLIAVMAFGRHLGRGKKISGLAAMPIEDLAVTKAFEILELLDTPDRARFADRLANLPPFQTLASALKVEKIYFSHHYCARFEALDESNLVPTIREMLGLPESFDWSNPLLAMLAPNGDPAERLLEACGSDRTRLVEMAAEVVRTYDILAEISEGQEPHRLAEIEARAAANPLLATELMHFKRVQPIWQHCDKRFSRLYHLARRAPGTEDESFAPRDGLN